MDNNEIVKQFQQLVAPERTACSMDAVKQEIESLVPLALSVLRDFLNREEISFEQKFKAAKYILDISSIGEEAAKAGSPQVTAMIQTFSNDQLAGLRQTADSLLASLKANKLNRITHDNAN
ncbi:MAG: hypothetical protein RBU23_12575 [Candidatus Auribacterota bacterium]|jgi:hypothetical protein|nr:hypothetical protein [Candidatus Auribacterota bacterium]